MAAAPIIIIFRMVHIVTSSNLRCAKTLAEQRHPLPHTEIRGSSWAASSVTKNTPTLMTLIGPRRQTDGSYWRKPPFPLTYSIVSDQIGERLHGRQR
jgi:hypothetical protein